MSRLAVCIIHRKSCPFTDFLSVPIWLVSGEACLLDRANSWYWGWLVSLQPVGLFTLLTRISGTWSSSYLRPSLRLLQIPFSLLINSYRCPSLPTLLTLSPYTPPPLWPQIQSSVPFSAPYYPWPDRKCTLHSATDGETRCWHSLPLPCAQFPSSFTSMVRG